MLPTSIGVQHMQLSMWLHQYLHLQLAAHFTHKLHHQQWSKRMKNAILN